MAEINQNKIEEKDEFQQIMELIRDGKNFLLSGGAGSGKTYTLVQVILQVIEENPTARVACMTYTNAAVKEIEERVDHTSLQVTTIHDFLWDNIHSFQKELKSSLIELINEEKIRINHEIPIEPDFFDSFEEGIQYKEFLRVHEGIISHDEILILANHVFQNYPKLCDILKDKFKFIFIDEYQDTQGTVVEIFLQSLKQSEKRNIIGFFGDSMQSIYEDGIGDLNQYIGTEVTEVLKKQNRRNPQLVIDLANKIRTDNLTQEPSSDENAPNMSDGQVKMGSIKFLYSREENREKFKNYLQWDFENIKKTKELNLTHNLIADKAEFRNLMDIYDKDPVIGLKQSILEKVKYNEKNGKPEIPIFDDDTFDQVVDKFQLKNRQKVLKKNILLQNQDTENLYNQLKDKKFSEVRKIYLSKDSLIDDKKQNNEEESKKGSKRDNLIKHLYKIQHCIFLYQSGLYNDFLRKTDFKIRSIQDKIDLKSTIEAFFNTDSKTIEEIIIEANKVGIVKWDDRIDKFTQKNEYLYNRVKNISFSEFQNLYKYLEGFTPFSTQHKTKGAEFDNVLVILDNGNWNDYNFEKLFTGSNNPIQAKRTQKIFYVCCTRAKENLAVFYKDPSSAVIQKAQEWFGQENVIDLDTIPI